MLPAAETKLEMIRNPLIGDDIQSSTKKDYLPYSSLKGFTFSMPDGWDDKNISIFLGCCKEAFEEFCDQRGKDTNDIWRTVAKAGYIKGGSLACFNINSCIELAQCLKVYIIKNINLDNKVFTLLCDDIKELLPYFPSFTETKRKVLSSEKKNIFKSNVDTLSTNLQLKNVSCLPDVNVKSGEVEKSVLSSVLSDPNVTTTSRVNETSTDLSKCDAHLKSSQTSRTDCSNVNKNLSLEEDPDDVHFETKYSLRGGMDNVKSYKPKPKKAKKPRAKAARMVINVEKRILPPRSVRNKVKSYKLSDDETSLSEPESCPSSPECRGFPEEPVPVLPLSPPLRIRRDYLREEGKTMHISQDRFDKRKTEFNDSIHPSANKRLYQPTNNQRDNMGLNLYGRTLKNPVVVLEQIDRANSRSLIETYRGREQVGQFHSLPAKTNVDLLTSKCNSSQNSAGSSESCRPSTSSSGQLPQSSLTKPASDQSMADHMTELEKISASSAAIANKCRQNIQNLSGNILKPAEDVINPSTSSARSNRISNRVVTVSNPPSWFYKFADDFRKHETWKVTSLVKMQQEVLDLESRKLDVLSQIIHALKND